MDTMKLYLWQEDGGGRYYDNATNRGGGSGAAVTGIVKLKEGNYYYSIGAKGKKGTAIYASKDGGSSLLKYESTNIIELTGGKAGGVHSVITDNYDGGEGGKVNLALGDGYNKLDGKDGTYYVYINVLKNRGLGGASVISTGIGSGRGKRRR